MSSARASELHLDGTLSVLMLVNNIAVGMSSCRSIFCALQSQTYLRANQ